MFDSLLVRSHDWQGAEKPLDLGSLVEGMIFYGNVEVILDPSSIKQIARAWSPHAVLRLLDCGLAKFKYRQNLTGIRTENQGKPNERHLPIVVEATRDEGGCEDPCMLLERAFLEVCTSAKDASRLAQQSLQRLEIHRTPESLPARSVADFRDRRFVNAAVRRLLHQLAPEYRMSWSIYFIVEEAADGLAVSTNIDFVAANASYHQRVSPMHSTLTPAFLLSHLVLAREIVEEAATIGGDLIVSDAQAALNILHIEAQLRSRRESANNIARFQEFSLEDSRAIAEAVNSGRVGIDQILPVLASSRKFRSWVSARPPDSDLAKAYFSECTKGTWIDQLPVKAARWQVFDLVGAAANAFAPGLGTVIQVADATILDRLLSGWKPNHFVDGVVRKFVKN